MLKKLTKKEKVLYLLSFFLPAFILFFIFIKREIFPFGDRSFLHIDMYHQYFPFLVEFYHKLKGGESLLYSWNTGIGSNFIALYAYYLASPFNWLCVFIPEHYLMEFLSYMVILKTGFCGLSFTYYIRKHFNTDSWTILCFSMFYALSGFMAAYNWDVMWLDVVVLAPVVILGLERLVFNGSCRLYCLSLALSILSNYYLSIMLCIFLVLYFIVLLIMRNPQDSNDSDALSFSIFAKLKNFYLKAVIRFCVYSLIAGGIAAVLLIPELAALKFTEFSDISFPSKLKLYFPVFDMVARHFFNVTVETGLDHWPNIYCGVAILILLPLYALQRKIPMREKAPKLALLGFMLISFSTNMLNFIWHGLNYPDSLPARQSFLYIFLMLVLCYEAFMNIREHSMREIISVFAGSLAFLILCEKLVTDDAFSDLCFFITGIFLIIYVVLICHYRVHKKIPVIAVFICLIVTGTEAGINTYITSVPTVSRDTYLSNYDSYQILTERTIENENGDFFRFDKFARRTQNDAMLIGFQGSSYFSSTLNSLVSDFYKRYGMKGSRVNYCFDGATPVTAALLSNRYMLYTLDRGYDNIFELADTQGELYVYKNNYSLPFGYMIAEDSGADFDSLFVSAEYMKENIHEDDDSDDLNPIERQNNLVHMLGISGDVFIPVDINLYGSDGDLFANEDAHYYAYTTNTKISSIEMNYEGKSKTYSQIKKKYILDLGYHTQGETLSFSSENDESLNLKAYMIDTDILEQFIAKLSSQTLSVSQYDETHLSGNIDVHNAGKLVMSVAYEPGWTLYVDGNKADMELFADTFISVYLNEGTHTIELKYFTPGLIPGAIISILSIAAFVSICIFQKKQALKKQ